MASSTPTFLSNILVKLGLEASQPPAPLDPHPRTDPLAEKHRRFCIALQKVGQLTASLRDRMTLIEVACQEAKILSASTGNMAPALTNVLSSLLPGLVSLLRENRHAAQTASSILMRYRQALEELKLMERALEDRFLLGSLREEESKGKFYHLLKLHLSVKDLPILCDLFPSPSAQAPTPAISPAPPAQSVARPVEEKHRQLLTALRGRILILQSACDAIRGDTSGIRRLSPTASAQAESLAKVLPRDMGTKKLVVDILACYMEASSLAKMTPQTDVERLQARLNWLMTLPQRIRGNILLEQILTEGVQ